MWSLAVDDLLQMLNALYFTIQGYAVNLLLKLLRENISDLTQTSLTLQVSALYKTVYGLFTKRYKYEH